MLRAAHAAGTQLPHAARRLLGDAHATHALHRRFSEAAKPGYVTAQQLKALLDGPRGAQFVDLRESEELAAASIPNFVHLPLSEAAKWAPGVSAALDARKQTIVMCQHGRSRSVAGAAHLIKACFADVKILKDGIEAYADVDPSVPKYAKYTPAFKF